MRTIVYLVTLIVSTTWNGVQCIVAGLLRVPYVPGGLYDRCQRSYGRSILRATGVTVTMEGAERIAAEGPQILLVNHSSFFEVLALLGYLPVYGKWIAKKELYRIPIFGGAIKAAGHVRIDRGNRSQAFSAYDDAARQMAEKKLTIVIYPEGTRTRTGELLPFKKGPFVFAIGSQAPVIPVYVGGAFNIQPKGSVRVRGRRMHIAVGEPIATAGLTMDDRDALVERARNAMLALKARVDPILSSS
jgi:1-acyl-sn-glycerol-3-phosphate acyltransferase